MEVEVAVGEEEERRRRMELKGEGEAEARREWRRGLVEVGAGGSPGWVGEAAAERTYRDGTGAGEEVRRRVPWRGVEAAGRCGRGPEEEGAGWSCGGVAVEEVHLWRAGEGAEEQDLERITVKIPNTWISSGEVAAGRLTLPPELVFDGFHSAVLLDEVVDDLGGLLVLQLSLVDAADIKEVLQLRVQVVQLWSQNDETLSKRCAATCWPRRSKTARTTFTRCP